jgi:pimeloyl-ACP methyl ester carboxylesterase
MSITAGHVGEGYAPVNGLQMYWRSVGEGGTPLILVHGGFGLADMFGGLLDQLAVGRRVVAVELQGHGHVLPPGWRSCRGTPTTTSSRHRSWPPPWGPS